MTSEFQSKTEIKQQVSDFYNQVGWQTEENGLYQNANYEDLRPVASEYIHRCHLRVARHLKPRGRYLLDAGSGPVQYPEYVEYSKNYQYRVCADISIVALQEARQRLGEHGLYVVADVSNLPFKPDVFDGLVSLHTIHHLPLEDHPRAYHELYRVLEPGSSAVVVNGAHEPPLTYLLNTPARWRRRWRKRRRQAAGIQKPRPKKGTYVEKHDARWIKEQVGSQIPLEIFVWRSVGTRFTRTYIHPRWGGKLWLRLLYWLEERLPRTFGRIGQYPMVVIHKAQDAQPGSQAEGV